MAQSLLRLLAHDIALLIQKHFMRNAALFVAIAFIAGCAAAPPPVKIASRLLGRNVLHQAKDQVTGSDETQTVPQQQP